MKMPSTFNGEVQVKTIRKVGAAFGGIIFTCRTTCPRKLRFVVVADYNVARLSKLYRVGHIWHVQGDVSEHVVRWNNGESKAEWQIKAIKLSFKKAANENLIALLENVASIGPGKAAKLAKEPGAKLFDIARDNDIETLEEYCSKDVATRLIAELRDYEALGAVQLLDECGVPSYISERALNIWGADTYINISINPYFLIAFEANLKLLDEFAINRLGFKPEAPERLEGYVKAALFDGFKDGHTCLKESKLKAKLRSKKQLASKALAEQALQHAYSNGTAIKIGDLVQVGSMHIIESTIAENILKLKNRKSTETSLTTLKAYISKYEQSVGFELTKEQHTAVLMACKSTIMLLTGGAGCGKTTVIEAICFVLEQARIVSEIRLMALAGKAAQRITESTDRDAITIAGFLNHDDSIKTDDSVFIIDESSMVDTLSLNRILKRIKMTGRIIFVGDQEQLPPVGVGLTLHKMVGMDLPHTHLSIVKRQSKASGIPAVADSIRNFPLDENDIEFADFKGIGSGVSFIETSADDIHDKVLSVYEQLEGNGCTQDIIVLSPMRQTRDGILEINRAIHENHVDKPDSQLKFSDKAFGVSRAAINGRPVCLNEMLMSKRNDYQRDIRNGSVGQVIDFDESEHTITINFNGNHVDFHFSELPYLEHANALTVHKSQGSQYKRVIVVVKDCYMLDRHLLYTAITRATEQVVLIGSKAVFYQALKISKVRETLLQHYFDELTVAEQ